MKKKSHFNTAEENIILEGFQTVFGKTLLPRRQLVQLLFTASPTLEGVRVLIGKLMQAGVKNVKGRENKLEAFLEVCFGPNARLKELRKDSSAHSSLEKSFLELAETRMDAAVDGPASVTDCLGMGCCTVSAFGMRSATQAMYQCLDCACSVCRVCVGKCHKGHKIDENSTVVNNTCKCGLYCSPVSCSLVVQPNFNFHSSFKNFPESVAKWFDLPVARWPMHISFLPLFKVKKSLCSFLLFHVVVFCRKEERTSP